MPIGQGGFEPVQASGKSGGFLSRLGAFAASAGKMQQQKMMFDYTQDRKDESMLKRYASEAAVKNMDRQNEFDLAHKHIMTHGSDFAINPATGKRERTTRKGVHAGRYSTGDADKSSDYGDKLIENSKIKQTITTAKLEALKLRQNSANKPKKTAAKKTAAKKSASKPKTSAKATPPTIKKPAAPKAAKPTTTTNNPELTKLKNSGKVAF